MKLWLFTPLLFLLIGLSKKLSFDMMSWILWHADCSAWRGFNWREYWYIRTELAALVNDWAGINMEIQRFGCHGAEYLLGNLLKRMYIQLVGKHVSSILKWEFYQKKGCLFYLVLLIFKELCLLLFLQGLFGESEKVKWRGTWVVKTVIKRHSIYMLLL